MSPLYAPDGTSFRAVKGTTGTAYNGSMPFVSLPRPSYLSRSQVLPIARCVLVIEVSGFHFRKIMASFGFPLHSDLSWVCWLQLNVHVTNADAKLRSQEDE